MMIQQPQPNQHSPEVHRGQITPDQDPDHDQEIETR